jgi:hypothetical protein
LKFFKEPVGFLAFLQEPAIEPVSAGTFFDWFFWVFWS